MRWFRRPAGHGALILSAALASAVACDSEETGQNSSGLCNVGYDDFAGPFLLNWCVGCHSSSLPEGQRQEAALEINFDTLDGLRKNASKARLMVVEEAMPPVGGPSVHERELFARWIDCGMPGATEGFSPPPPTGKQVVPAPPTGTCAEPHLPLPASVLPRCQASTLDCVIQCGIDDEGYGGDVCRDACLAADTMPAAALASSPINCQSCTLAQLLACAETSCHDEMARFLCCAESCAGVESCTTARCSGDLTAFGLCVGYLSPECVDYVTGPISSCFAEGSRGGEGGSAGAGGAGGTRDTGGAGGG
jgi:hypothetical protein